jgi:hypothetical protein
MVVLGSVSVETDPNDGRLVSDPLYAANSFLRADSARDTTEHDWIAIVSLESNSEPARVDSSRALLANIASREELRASHHVQAVVLDTNACVAPSMPTCTHISSRYCKPAYALRVRMATVSSDVLLVADTSIPSSTLVVHASFLLEDESG